MSDRHSTRPNVLVRVGRWVLVLLLSGGLAEAQAPFVRGDANADAQVNLGDAVLTLGYIFSSAPVGCVAALDAQGDDAVDISDPVYVLGYLFNSGTTPPPPFPACGLDPGTPLSCSAHPACGLDPLSALDDSFDGGALDSSWSVLNPSQSTTSVSAGSLRLEANGTSLWFNADTAVQVSKPVTGDFTASSTVHARRASDSLATPCQLIHLGGLMARNPVSPLQKYVFIVLGMDVNDLSVETKTTTDSVSDFVGPSWPVADAELRVCRRGAMFELYAREVGAPSWLLQSTYFRPDLPATLEVGPIMYAFQPTPDLVISVDEVVFRTVTNAADCLAD